MTSVQETRSLSNALALVEGSRRAWDGGVSPEVQGLAPDVQRLAPDVQRLAPDVQRLAPDVQRLAPDVQGLAPDVQAWLASPEEGLTAAIREARGAEEAVDALASLAPSRLTVLAMVSSDRACWFEIARRAGGEDETCVAGLSFDAAGRVSRLIWLRAPLVPMADVDAAPTAPDARPILERYFADLMRSRFREAAAHFTADTIYSHPPYAGGSERVLFAGREALWRGFETERGPSPARQIITELWQRGSRVFVEGVIEGIPDGGTFFSTAQITPEGEIARYVAFYSATRIPAAGPA